MHLSRFSVGQVYEVGTSLGSYLLAMGAAEPLADDSTKLNPLASSPDSGEARGRPPFPRAVAANTRAGKKKR